MKRKICVVITARPSYARIRTALEAIRDHEDLELQLVVAASALLDKYGSAVDVIEKEGFKVDRRVYSILDGENLVTSAKSTGFGLAELATVFDDLKPDMVVTIADRFETMATAVAGAYMNIPLVHIQGGEVTGSIDDKVRHAITKLADIHLVSCEGAAERVKRMGEADDRVILTGCPSIDIARMVKEQERPEIKQLIYEKGGVGADLDISQGYVVVLQHPVTTEHELARAHINETLHAVRDTGYPALWFWPNVDAGSDGTSGGIRAFREAHRLRNVHFYKNMPPEDFLHVLIGSNGIVGNSSVAIRECSYLGVPAVNIGTRQRGRDQGPNVVDVLPVREDIKQAIQQNFARGRVESAQVYGDGYAAQRIADALAKVELSIEKPVVY